MSKIIDIVKFNDGHAYVLDEGYSLTYERHNSLLIGSDETQTFFDVLYCAPCGGNRNFGGNYAFGGREFDLQMKDGTTTHCYGQYWSGKFSEAEKILGIEFAHFTNNSQHDLRNCYVFCGGTISKSKLWDMLERFEMENPNYKVWDYWEYERHIKEVTT